MQDPIDPYVLIDTLYAEASELILEPLRPYLEVSCEYGALLVKDLLRRLEREGEGWDAKRIADGCDRDVIPRLQQRFGPLCLERDILEVDHRVVAPALVHAWIATEEDLVLPGWDDAARREVEHHMLAAGAAMPVGSFFLRLVYELLYVDFHALVLIAFLQALRRGWGVEEAVACLRQHFEQRALTGTGAAAVRSFAEIYTISDAERSETFRDVLETIAEAAGAR